MATTPVYTVNNPVPNSHYYGPSAPYWCVPNAGTTVTCTVECFDSAGNLIVSSITAVVNDYTTQLNVGSFSGNYNTVNANNTNTVNGSDVYRAGGWTASSGVAYLKMWLTYTGHAYDQPPNTPTNLAPNGLITNLSPTFTASFSDPTSGDTFAQYEVQVANAANGGGNVIWDTGNQATNTWEQQNATLSLGYSGPALAFGSQYSWRVRMANQNGLWSGWSGWSNFNTASGPNTPSSLTPNGVQTTLTPGWGFYYGSSGGYAMQAYRYQVLNASGSSIYDSGNVAASTASGTAVAGTLPSGILNWGQSYTFTVAAQDTNGAWSPWGSVAFNVAARPTATQNSPVGGVTVNTQTPTFGWTFNDPNYGQSYFQVKVYNNAGTLLQDSTKLASSATSWTMTSSVAYGTSCYWQLQVWDAAGLVSDVFTAYFAVNNLPTVAITAPANNAILQTATPTITWTYTASAGGYAQASVTLTLTDGNGNTLATYTQSGAGTSYTLPTGVLINRQSYKVTVAATDTNAEVGTSPSVAFSLQYTSPADMQGQALANAHNYLLGPLLNTDANTDGVADNWSLAASGAGVTQTPYLDLSVLHSEALASGDGPIAGTQAISFSENAASAQTEQYLYQTLNLQTLGWVAGASRLALKAQARLSVSAGNPAVFVALAFYSGATLLSQAYSTLAYGDTGLQYVPLTLPNVTIPAGATSVQVQLRLRLNDTNGTPGAGTVWWLEPQLEKTVNTLTDPALNATGSGGVVSGWSESVATGVTATPTLDTTVTNPVTGAAGAQKLAVTADSGPAAGSQLAWVYQDVTLASAGLAVGQSLNAGAWVEVASATGAPVAKVSVSFYDAGNALLGTTTGASQGATSGAFVFLAGPSSLTIPANAVKARLSVGLYCAVAGDTGTLWVGGAFLGLATVTNDPAFIEGSLGTGYSYDGNGYSVRAYLPGGLPTIVANPGAATDPATASGGSILVSWDTSLADAKFTYYLLERRRQDQQSDDTAWVTLATISNANIGSYVDFAVGNGVIYQYSIRQVVTYVDGTTGFSQHRAIITGSVVFGAYYLTNTSGILINLRMNTVTTSRDFEWKENAVYTPFLGRTGQARDAGPDLGYAFSLDAYWSQAWGDDPASMRRLLLQMEQMGVQWLYRDPAGVVVPVWLQGVKWKLHDDYGDQLMTATFTVTQAQATTDY